MKDIKDYAQFYIGQKCLNTWFPAGHEQYNRGWVLAGFVGTYPKPYCLENVDDTTWTDSIKPILRRLEDMTEAEKIFVCHMHMPAGWSAVSLLSDSETDWAMRITDPQKGHLKTLYVRKDRLTPHAFHYLLKQGFDLWGLIEGGHAIDHKTLNQKA